MHFETPLRISRLCLGALALAITRALFYSFPMSLQAAPEKAPKKPIGNLIASIIFGIILAGLIVFVILNWSQIMDLIGDEKKLEAWIDAQGPWAPIVFIFIQILQVVVFVIPGEVPQIAGGYLFGIPLGTLYSVIGIGIGSAFCFMTAKTLGLSFITRLFGKEQVDKFERFISSPRSVAVFFLLFLIPGIPKDILCYIAGVSYLKLGPFMLISMIARLPALVGSMIIGQSLADNNIVLLVVISVVATVLFVLGIIFRKKIFAWLEGMVPIDPKKSPEKAEHQSSETNRTDA